MVNENRMIRQSKYDYVISVPLITSLLLLVFVPVLFGYDAANVINKYFSLIVVLAMFLLLLAKDVRVKTIDWGVIALSVFSSLISKNFSLMAPAILIMLMICFDNLKCDRLLLYYFAIYLLFLLIIVGKYYLFNNGTNDVAMWRVDKIIIRKALGFPHPNIFMLEYIGMCFSLLLIQKHGYSFLMQDASKIKRFVYWGIEKVIGFSRSTTISCSEGEFKESQKLTNNNELVNNGVDIDELQKLRSNFQCDDGENISIFTIGRISKQKNPDLFNEIAKKFPKIKFIWIGDGNLRSELTSKNIEVTGWLQRNEAIKLAMKSNFFILTSLWEGLPISLLESMFLGKECFVSNVIGNKDVIEDGVNGFICSDLSDFENKIKNLILNRKMGEKIAESARLDILKKYNTKVMASEYKKIYSSK